MQSTLQWFTALKDERKLEFLALAGTQLTAFGKDAATTWAQLKALNEISYELYRAMSVVAAGKAALNADLLWATLNELAVQSKLDQVLEASFAGAKSLAQTLQGF
jgi:hypothetical protein